MKSQEVRIAEAMNLRSQWKKQVVVSFPYELVARMNGFVRDGIPSTGVVDFIGRELEYTFACDEGQETYIRLKASSQR
jgi:hypothetical protein